MQPSRPPHRRQLSSLSIRLLWNAPPPRAPRLQQPGGLPAAGLPAQQGEARERTDRGVQDGDRMTARPLHPPTSARRRAPASPSLLRRSRGRPIHARPLRLPLSCRLRAIPQGHLRPI